MFDGEMVKKKFHLKNFGLRKFLVQDKVGLRKFLVQDFGLRNFWSKTKLDGEIRNFHFFWSKTKLDLEHFWSKTKLDLENFWSKTNLALENFHQNFILPKALKCHV